MPNIAWSQVKARGNFSSMNTLTALITFAVGFGGVILGGLLSRHNERRAHGERLLVEALNDAATAIADVAGGEGKPAQSRYASAMSRIALHASPAVIARFREFQDDATTTTPDGRLRLIEAVLEARRELGHGRVDSEDLAVLLFGSTEPDERFTADCKTWVALGDFKFEPASSPWAVERAPTGRLAWKHRDGS